MGASGWDYIEPFDTDLATTLANLRKRVFEEDGYFWFESIPKPATLAELDALLQQDEDDLFDGELDFDSPEFQQLMDLATTGTHSVLDARGVGGRGSIRIVPPAAVEALFGSPQPSRADFERAPEGQRMDVLGDYTGACVQLHDATGAVTEVGFWGISGD
jgi:hypothetical protein